MKLILEYHQQGRVQIHLALEWLIKVFDPYTCVKAERSRRLLIVDGHSSYVNMAFLDKCDQLRIIVLILLPHSTH
jgi:hypothetical protein